MSSECQTAGGSFLGPPLHKLWANYKSLFTAGSHTILSITIRCIPDLLQVGQGAEVSYATIQGKDCLSRSFAAPLSRSPPSRLVSWRTSYILLTRRQARGQLCYHPGDTDSPERQTCSTQRSRSALKTPALINASYDNIDHGDLSSILCSPNMSFGWAPWRSKSMLSNPHTAQGAFDMIGRSTIFTRRKMCGSQDDNGKPQSPYVHGWGLASITRVMVVVLKGPGDFRHRRAFRTYITPAATSHLACQRSFSLWRRS
ncbi:uncharacterized protein B0J16DRAFT_381661 [Fusarium flagelliforme]|uniref:uncharacterized protein n=1 Tax=Fusarium flagelliforme TaxID=2675880 RepID=UPI001E8DE9E3|nr:uncharacterized protein B0J16DRAFT_381661 [Fusarium flagelliforme]KAH7193783.1 hypothetical protein B0J16DRAFT_381661 [Fusarium flagelliforme]